jgi:hypothetical protein
MSEYSNIDRLWKSSMCPSFVCYVLFSFSSASSGILGTGKCFTALRLHELCIWLKIPSLYLILYQIIIRFTSLSASHEAERRMQPFGQEAIHHAKGCVVAVVQLYFIRSGFVERSTR